jgi:hypothetical protein
MPGSLPFAADLAKEKSITIDVQGKDLSGYGCIQIFYHGAQESG